MSLFVLVVKQAPGQECQAVLRICLLLPCKKVQQQYCYNSRQPYKNNQDYGVIQTCRMHQFLICIVNKFQYLLFCRIIIIPGKHFVIPEKK